MTPLENYLVLHRFRCNEFGYPNLRSMLGRLPHDLDLMVYDGTESEYTKVLCIPRSQFKIGKTVFWQ